MYAQSSWTDVMGLLWQSVPVQVAEIQRSRVFKKICVWWRLQKLHSSQNWEHSFFFGNHQCPTLLKRYRMDAMIPWRSTLDDFFSGIASAFSFKLIRSRHFNETFTNGGLSSLSLPYQINFYTMVFLLLAIFDYVLNCNFLSRCLGWFRSLSSTARVTFLVVLLLSLLSRLSMDKRLSLSAAKSSTSLVASSVTSVSRKNFFVDHGMFLKREVNYTVISKLKNQANQISLIFC
jgi:hypothetical protein